MRIILLLSILLSLGYPARAQENESQIHAPGSIYQNPAVDEIRRLKKESREKNDFITPSRINISLVKHDYMDDDQFGILMSVPEVVSGCFELSPLQYETTFIDPYYMDVKVKDYQRKVIETSNVASGCPAQNKMSTALMVLNKSDLQQRETRQIRFSNGQVSDYYDIAWGEKTLTLRPQSMVVFKAQNLEGAMKDQMSFHFEGSDRVALRVPMAKAGDDITGAMVRFASQNALTPVGENTPETHDSSGVPVFIFRDVTGRVISQIGTDGVPVNVGNITVGRPYDGPQGRTTTAVPLNVYASKP